MDNSHIALVSLELKQECFESYRCDRNMSLGMNLNSFTKILKCAGNDDQVKITASDDTDVLGLQFQNRSTPLLSIYKFPIASKFTVLLPFRQRSHGRLRNETNGY